MILKESKKEESLYAKYGGIYKIWNVVEDLFNQELPQKQKLYSYYDKKSIQKIITLFTAFLSNVLGNGESYLGPPFGDALQ